MSDREALLRAILARPDDLTARLVYADWLDEHPDLPGAAAAAEFTRLACGPPRGPWPMPRGAYQWLRANWKLLLPSVVALSVPVTETSERWRVIPDGGMYQDVKGSGIDTYVTLPGKLWDGGARLYSCRLRLHFGRGLLDSWEMHSAFGRERVLPALRADQPHLFLGPAGEGQPVIVNRLAP